MVNPESFEIIVLPESFHITSTNMHGSIWVTDGKNHFPEENWDDFVIVVLGWWITTVLSLIDGVNNNSDMQFMDGSFHIRIIADEGVWKLECIAGYINRESIEHIFEASRLNFFRVWKTQPRKQSNDVAN